MAAQQGRDLLIKIHDGSGDFDDENYVVVGGIKTNSFDISGEAVDITNKDSNGFKELLPGSGNVAVSITGDGVFVDDASFKRVHDHTLARTHPSCRIVVPDFATYTGVFSISKLTLNGNDGEAVTYSIQLNSSGAVTVATL
ncbi:phage major tail protein, TP901-1 family [Kordiimonas pumila]|uniref:Phage major tail protein, TP901-1 family n=1 Tax=Kordiimonas pumila TaxID=2161677 RepID=A0ABV7D450_9PROT|nr:phage major tail protein, TP901-1 family [Kordiimonas pumila]